MEDFEIVNAEIAARRERIATAAEIAARRERIATAALQGLLADSNSFFKPEVYAEGAVKMAVACGERERGSISFGNNELTL